MAKSVFDIVRTQIHGLLRFLCSMIISSTSFVMVRTQYSKVNQNCTNLRSMKLWARKQVREINEVCLNIVFIHMTICQTSIHKKTIYVRLGFCLPVKHTHKKKLLYGLYRHHLFHMVAIVSTEWVPTIFKFQW